MSSDEVNRNGKNADEVFIYLHEKVKDQISNPLVDFKPESNVTYDLGLDSLQMYDLVIDLEEKYDIRLSDEDLERVQTVQDFVDLINLMAK